MKRIPNSDEGRRELARRTSRNRRLAKLGVVVFGVATVALWGYLFVGG